MRRLTVREIKSPPALAAFGAFFVPEPLGACLVVAAAIWWLCRKPFLHNRRLLVHAESDGEDDKSSRTYAEAETPAEHRFVGSIDSKHDRPAFSDAVSQ